STKNIFSIWEWVGGRFSLWSAVGLPIAIALGYETFEDLLHGAQEMDQHLLTSPPNKNLPLILALISIWNVNFLGIPTHSIIPYDARLKWLPRFLQQLEMESNGKNINFLGKPVSYQTAPVIFGQVGTEAQHSFFQLLHQGTQPLSCDFLIAVEGPIKKDIHYESVVANAFAQSEALMSGVTEKNAKAELLKKRISKTTLTKLLPHKVLDGNKPSNTLIYRHLNPATLGMLLALYEHKVAIQGKIWQINSFDQWGVEYGKQLANTIKNALVDQNPGENLNPSTANLVSVFQKMRKEPH
ncbi:MAG: glucose-6-phosphate isomerase, partial [Magnetovibrio sp.]|nr:glucose-6-phosphate isomerase [Magnetovibrio sp.]